MNPLYLDFNATTPLDPRVFEAMRPWYLNGAFNAGSRTHSFGQSARSAVERAREQIGVALGAPSEEIVFTSGATESNNLALQGMAAHGVATRRMHIISTAIEHKAVLEPLAYLETQGFELDLVPVTRGGFVEVSAIAERLRPDTLLVSVMHANNETGILQPVEEIAMILDQTGTIFHVDAAQTFGKEVEELRHLRYDLLSISGHKIYGPQGSGALHVRRRKLQGRAVAPVMRGGGQERGIRPGTLPVALIVGLGEAAALANLEYKHRQELAATLKQEFLDNLAAVDFVLNGDLERSQAHVVNLSFPAVDSEALMVELRDVVAISNGSACTSSQYAPSHVLTAMGLEEERIESAVRVSWGIGVDHIPSDAFVDAIQRLRL